MNILYISQTFPYFPCCDGFRLISYNMIKRLSKNHAIHLISFKNSKDELQGMDSVTKFCVSVEPIFAKRKTSLLNSIKSALLPYEWNTEMSEKIINAIKRNNFDVIHVEGMNVAQYVYKIETLPKVVSPHDVFSEKAYQFIKSEKSIMKKMQYVIQWVKAMNFEKKVYKKFERCVVVGPRDKEVFQKYLPGLDIDIIANGVDTEYYRYKPLAAENSNIIFTGNMSFPPNIDAALYFYNNIFPMIVDKVKDAKLYIVGAEPAREILNLKKDHRVIVTGLVDDIRPFIYNSCVYVCPLRLGMGIKNKILEAMAMGIPIVATKLSTIGIDIVEGKDLLIADEEKIFADKVVELLNDKITRLKLTNSGRKLVETQYSWESKANLLENVYEAAIYKHKYSYRVKMAI